MKIIQVLEERHLLLPNSDGATADNILREEMLWEKNRQGGSFSQVVSLIKNLLGQGVQATAIQQIPDGSVHHSYE